MGSTYLQLTNKVLRRVNEVELTETTFTSARGIQAVCKDAVLDSINEINQQRWEWPFYAQETTQLLTIGENEYNLPVRFKSADWESFQIVENDALQVRSRNLKQIDRDEWYKFFKPQDDDADPLGRGVPHFVFLSHGEKFGVTPSPDKAYSVYFRYYKTPPILSVQSNICEIPSDYDNVILAGALKHVNLFKENAQGFQIADGTFKKGISDMYNSLVGYTDHIYDNRANYAQIPLIIKAGNYRI